VLRVGSVAGAALDGAIDIVIRHALRPRAKNGAAQADVCGWIAAT